MPAKADVIVLGGGFSGLCCALKLHQRGISFLLLEASDGAGGRVRTDRVEGFLLDRGFQVLLTAYPEAQRVLDYRGLDLHYFYPGALVRFGGRFHKTADPWQHPRFPIRPPQLTQCVRVCTSAGNTEIQPPCSGQWFPGARRPRQS